MTPEQFEAHTKKCEDIRERRPCSHQVELNCANCNKLFAQPGVWMTVKFAYLCDDCVPPL